MFTSPLSVCASPHTVKETQKRFLLHLAVRMGSSIIIQFYPIAKVDSLAISFLWITNDPIALNRY